MFNSDSGETELIETWQRFVQGLLGVLALVGALVMAHYYSPPDAAGLEQQVHQLSTQVADLERQQSFSAETVDRCRRGIVALRVLTGFITSPAAHKGLSRSVVSGTGFA